MRVIVAGLLASFAFLALALPVLAQGGSLYQDEDYGFEIDIPSGFSMIEDYVAGKDYGLVFVRENETLSVWGGYAEETDYETELAQRAEFILGSGDWEYVDGETTADYSWYTVASGDYMLTYYAIPLCGGDKYAAYQYEYDNATDDGIDTDAALLNSLVDLEDC